MTSMALRRFRLALMIPLVVASLALSGQAASADDPVELPTQPNDLRVVVNPGTRSCVAAWTALPEATHYRLRWRSRGAGFLPGDQVVVEQPGAAFTVPHDGQWVVRLEACNAAGCGPGIARMVATTPADPANLVVSFTTGGLTLSATWDAAAGASSYRLRWRRPDGNFLPRHEVTATATGASFTVPEAGRWVVRVEGCNDAGCGPGISQVVTTLPGRPANFTASATAGQLTLTAAWDPAPGASSYRLRWRRPDGNFLPGREVVATATGANFTVPESGRWTVRVEGCNVAGCGLGVTRTVSIVPGRPKNLSVSAAPGALQVTAAWDAAPGASSYKLRWRRFDTDFLPANQVIVTATHTSFTVSESGRWVVRVEGCDAAGCGRGVNAVVTATAAPEPAPGPTVRNATVNGATLTLTFSEDLYPYSLPDLDAFTVTVAGSARQINGYGHISADLIFALGSAVAVGQTVTVSYVRAGAGSGPLRNAAGSEVASFFDRIVTNDTPPLPPQPIVNSATLHGTTLTIPFNKPLSPLSVPAAGTFSVAHRDRSIIEDAVGVAVRGASVIVTLASPYPHGEAVEVFYVQPWSNPLRGDVEAGRRGTEVGTFAFQVWPTNAPAKPASLTAAGGDGEVVLSWASGGDGGSQATGWQYRQSRDGGTTWHLDWTAIPGSGADTTTYTVSGLTNGTAYTFMVRAVNAVGNSDASDPATATPVRRLAVSVCNRTPEVRDALIAAVGKNCAEITAADLAEVGYLVVSNKGATSLQTGDFDGLSNLGQLELDGNVLTSLPTDVFHGLSSLETLTLYDNALTSLPEDVFEGLSRLGYLDLGGNALTALPEDVFDGLSRLHFLDLQLNDLTSLPADVFDGLSSLTQLYLDDNALTTLPADVFDGLSRLRFLNLDENALTALPADVFDGSPSLARLDLDHNDLTALPEGVFDGLSSLMELYLHDNALTSLPADVFHGLSSIGWLKLTENALTALPADVFAGLNSLAWLDLDDNALTTLPADVFDGLISLAWLKLDGNDLTALPEDVFDGLARLRQLYLDYNALTTLPDGVFDGLSSLTSMRLDHNDLSVLPEDLFDDISSLKWLDLGYNALTALPEDIFDGLSDLKWLDLNYNPLTALPDGVFDDLVSLETLDLDYNHLTALPDGVFDELLSLVTLDLTGNPGAPFAVNLGPDVEIRQ